MEICVSHVIFYALLANRPLNVYHVNRAIISNKMNVYPNVQLDISLLNKLNSASSAIVLVHVNKYFV